MVESIAVQMVSTQPLTRCISNRVLRLIIQVATECLHTLFTRILLEDDDFQKIVCPMYHAQTVGLLRNIFNWIQVDPNNIDEERYLFLKRFSEVTPSLKFLVGADDAW